jgi:hypothetical protein
MAAAAAITVPVGGEVYAVGDTVPVAWTGFCPSLVRVYMLPYYFGYRSNYLLPDIYANSSTMSSSFVVPYAVIPGAWWTLPFSVFVDGQLNQTWPQGYAGLRRVGPYIFFEGRFRNIITLLFLAWQL